MRDLRTSLLSPAPHFLGGADTAISIATPIDVSGRVSERMSLLTGGTPWPPMPELSTHVFGMRNDTQMIGSHAMLDMADVVDLQAVRDRTDERFVIEPMDSSLTPAGSQIRSAPSCDSISVGLASTFPKPARPRLADFARYAFGQHRHQSTRYKGGGTDC